jgi:hypothetical protein
VKLMVLGTSPDYKFPDASCYDRIIASNGAIGLAKAANLKVNILVTTAHIVRPNALEHEQASVKSWAGTYVERIFVDETDGSKKAVEKTCSEIGLAYDAMTGISAKKRNEIVHGVCGQNLGKGPVSRRVSTGFFSLCLAMISQPESVVIVGLGFQNGHAELPDNAPRYHAPADAQCLQELLKRYSNISTTSEELNEKFGVPLV